MAYTTAAAVKAVIGSSVYNATDLSDSHIAGHITRADGVIDAALADMFSVPFNGSTATPATPAVVAQAAEYLAVAYCLRQLAIKGSNQQAMTEADEWESMADNLVSGLRSLPSQMRPETVSSETVTLQGSTREDWQLNEYEGFIGASGTHAGGQVPNILEDTVRILATSSSSGYTAADLADLRNGLDFRVYFDPEHRRYIFEALHQALQDADTINITYQWDYRRKTGESTRRSGELFLA